MCNLLKKTLAICLIGFGLGILLVLLLPMTGWLFIIGITVIAVGLMCGLLVRKKEGIHI